jgi:outer membrane lipoprotein-sorting protein
MKKPASLGMKRMLFALCAVASPALAADPTGPELLAKIDHGLNCFKDATFEAKLLVKESSGAREYGFTTFQKGEKRLVRFNSPGDVKGMGVLIENPTTMYVFLPGFQRVRRMGGHVKNQTFMGSDFASDEMSATAFAPLYDAKLVGQDDKTWILELSQKPGQDLEFPRLKLWAEKNSYFINKIENYDDKGKKLKTQERSEYKKDSPEHWQPFHIVMTDHRRGDHKSEILFTNTKIDSGISDDMFSVRQLVRGN